MTRDWTLSGLGFAVAAAGIPLFQGHPETFLVQDSGMMPRWVILGVSSGLILWNASWRHTALHAWATLSLFCVGIAIFWSPNHVEGIWTFWLAWLTFTFFCFGSAAEDLSRFYRWCAWGIFPSTILVIGEAIGAWTQIGASPFPGLFINRTFLAEAAVLVLLACAMSRDWASVLLVLPAVALAQNRASWLALAIVAGMLLCARRKYLAIAAPASAFVALAWHFGGTSSLGFRLEIWRTALTNLKWAGWGSGSFYTIFPSLGSTYAVLGDRPEYPHNEIVGLLFELGLFSLPILALVLGLALCRGPERERMVLIAGAVLCMFTFPLHMPFTLFFLALVAGNYARSWGLDRVESPDCGSAVLPRMVSREA